MRNTCRPAVAAAIVGATLAVGGCGSDDAERVASTPNMYCYRNLAEVTCYDAPIGRDYERLVTYSGPAPKPAFNVPDAAVAVPPPPNRIGLPATLAPPESAISDAPGAPEAAPDEPPPPIAAPTAPVEPVPLAPSG